MLALKPNCERCDADLPPASNAFICTFECTFCKSCATKMDHICPNCQGNLVERPIRTKAALTQFPASTQRILKPHDD